jgi:hypothetical protein
MHNKRAGEGTKFTRVGTYATNRPIGGGMPKWRHFKVVESSKFAPAESPAATIRSPSTK